VDKRTTYIKNKRKNSQKSNKRNASRSQRRKRKRSISREYKCYVGVPPEFKDSKKMTFDDQDKLKLYTLGTLTK